MRSGLTGTIYEPILQFYCSHTKVAVCKEPNLHILVQICKNIRGLILLGNYLYFITLNFISLKIIYLKKFDSFNYLIKVSSRVLVIIFLFFDALHYH